MFFEQMHPIWQSYLADKKAMLQGIEEQVLDAADLVPPVEMVMRAFIDDPTGIRVVILGQDPYPGPGDAIGLAFAVEPGRTRPASLRNILRELHDDVGIDIPENADLASWAKRGVLLLNTSLTSLSRQPEAHSKIGWLDFTLFALTELAQRQNIVVLAWGNHAKKISSKLSVSAVIESAHPSPLSASRGFLGSKPFSRANQALIQIGLEPIDWTL